MSEWKPMKTAPTDERVEVGKWDSWTSGPEWKTTIGAPYESGLFGRKATYYAREYSHWRPAPPAPDGDA